MPTDTELEALPQAMLTEILSWTPDAASVHALLNTRTVPAIRIGHVVKIPCPAHWQRVRAMHLSHGASGDASVCIRRHKQVRTVPQMRSTGPQSIWSNDRIEVEASPSRSRVSIKEHTIWRRAYSGKDDAQAAVVRAWQ